MSWLTDEVLRRRLKLQNEQSFRVISRESTNLEFKESFNFGSLSSYFKTMAALANNSGGYLIFGVTDSPRVAIGLSRSSLQSFESIRVEEITKQLQSYFDPEISWEHRTYEISDRNFGVIYIHKLDNRPCICKKTLSATNPKASLREGDIFYRYGGRSERIHYTELREILDATRKSEQELWLDLVRNAMSIGVENASLLDLSTGRIGLGSGAIVLDQNLVERMRFVKQGEFSETVGAPTLRLLGEVQEVRSNNVLIDQPSLTELRGIETHDVVASFLESKQVENPLEYLKRVCSENSPNYPVFYFAYLSNLPFATLIENLELHRTTSGSKERVLDRLRGEKIQEVPLGTSEHPSSVRKRALRAQLLEQNSLGVIETIQQLKDTLSVICSLSDEEMADHAGELKEIMHSVYFDWIEDLDSNVKSQLRKSISKLDQALFRVHIHPG